MRIVKPICIGMVLGVVPAPPVLPHRGRRHQPVGPLHRHPLLRPASEIQAQCAEGHRHRGGCAGAGVLGSSGKALGSNNADRRTAISSPLSERNYRHLRASGGVLVLSVTFGDPPKGRGIRSTVKQKASAVPCWASADAFFPFIPNHLVASGEHGLMLTSPWQRPRCGLPPAPR